jgi:ParB-like chromosome segregation protein Spo0J
MKRIKLPILPILADSDGVIISGYGRVLAARNLQRKTVPVVILYRLSETQRRIDVLAPIHRGGSK